eukprot:6188611-Pleurochrysis_carterae.AAC.2
MCPAWSVQNTRALDKAQAAESSCPFESARQPAVSRRSAASAKVELCGRVLYAAVRSPPAIETWGGASGVDSMGVREPALIRTSIRASSIGFIALDRRERSGVARERLVACIRCIGMRGRQAGRCAHASRCKGRSAAISPAG